MVALAPNNSETSTWDVLDRFPKMHSRAREAKTSNCTEARHSKSLGRVEIWLMIYESCVGLESFTRDPIGFMGSAWNLYEMLATAPLVRIDPRGYQSTTAGDTPSDTIPDMLRQAIPCPAEIETLATNSCTNYGGVKAGFPKCYKSPDPLVPGAYLKSYDVFCKDLDCEFSKFQWIKDRKDAYCKVDGVSTSCVDIDCPCDRKTCGKIWNNIRDNRGCWKAREDEANLCFKGREDAGHKQAREDAKKAFETCQDKKKECKCSYVFTP